MQLTSNTWQRISLLQSLMIYMENWLPYIEFSIETIKHACIYLIAFFFLFVVQQKKFHAIICLVSYLKFYLTLFLSLLGRHFEFADPDKNTLSISPQAMSLVHIWKPTIKKKKTTVITPNRIGRNLGGALFWPPVFTGKRNWCLEMLYYLSRGRS